MYREYYRPRALDTTTLFPGVAETLVTLRSRGIRMAIATTKSTETTRRVLQHFGIEHEFDQIQGTTDLPFKPDPFIVNKILTDQGWTPAESIMVGDTAADIGAGKAAGVSTCGVTYGSSSREVMELLGPDHIIGSLIELPAIIFG